MHGIIRRSSSFNTDRIDHLYRNRHETGVNMKLYFADLNDASSLQKVLQEAEPHEVYNLAAQSHVRVSFDIPEYTAEITALGTIRLLEAILLLSDASKAKRLLGWEPKVSFKELVRMMVDADMELAARDKRAAG